MEESQPVGAAHNEKNDRVAECMAYLLTVDDYTTEECYKRFATLAEISFDRVKHPQLGRYLADVGFGELYVPMHKCLFGYNLLNEDDVGCRRALINLMEMQTFYLNFTDTSKELCESLGRSGALELAIEELALPDQFESGNMIDVVQATLTILVNSVRLCGDNRSIYRRVGAVEILMKLRNSVHTFISIYSLLILSYIVNEEESEKIEASDGCIDFLLGLANDALKRKGHRTCNCNIEEVMQGISNLALNDANKVKIVQKFGLDPVVKMLTVGFSHNELELAATLVWKLAFIPANREVIRQNKPLVEALTQLMGTSDNPSLREACTGALWEITEGKIDLPKRRVHCDRASSAHEGASADDKHVMISYQWDVQEQMIRLKEKLIAAGYKVWMDIEKMKGDILVAMADAVENSAVILVCMSQKYKDSVNTRSEASYARQRKIPIIPLLVEKDYSANGWLGLLLGSLLYIKFYEDIMLEQNLSNLMRELGNRGKAKTGCIRTDVPSLGKPPAPGRVGQVDVATWNKNLVQKWLIQHQLLGIGKKLREFDGTLLVQLHKLSQRAPEFFYSTLRQDLGLDLVTMLKLTDALEKLMI